MNNFQPVRAIFYDLDGTLRLNDPPGRIAVARQAAALGLEFSLEGQRRMAKWEHYYFAESPELVHDRQEFLDDSQAFWLNYNRLQLQMLGANLAQAQALAAQISAYMTEHYKPNDVILDEVYATLAQLRKQGYYLGVMSNRFNPYADYLRERGLNSAFNLVMYAGEAGIRKPNPQVFHYMLAKAGFTAAESIYIGDNYFADVLGARQAGMRAVLYDREQLFEQPDCPVITSHEQIYSFLNGGEICLGKQN